MKFDNNGKKIVVKRGVSLSEEFLGKVKLDIKKVAEYLKVEVPEVKLKNGGGGDYTKSENLVRIGFSDAEYNNSIRRVIVHEMLHHKGYHHGRVNGHLFMSHENNDHVSPILVEKIFA